MLPVAVRRLFDDRLLSDLFAASRTAHFTAVHPLKNSKSSRISQPNFDAVSSKSKQRFGRKGARTSSRMLVERKKSECGKVWTLSPVKRSFAQIAENCYNEFAPNVARRKTCQLAFEFKRAHFRDLNDCRMMTNVRASDEQKLSLFLTVL